MSVQSRIFAGTIAAGIVLGLPVAASAQSDDYVREPTEVSGENFNRPTKVEGTTFARDTGTSPSLALTGGDVFGIAAMGLGAIGVGSVLVRRGRTRSTAS